MKSSNAEYQECIKCLYRSTHPFGLEFDDEGTCSGCITHREKTYLNWNNRFTELKNKIYEIKLRNKNKHYDCVVPVRGTPEHFYVLDTVKNKLKLNPLVVCYNSQFNSKVGIMNLDIIRDVFDVDILVYFSNPIVYKKMIRESLLRLTNMRWPYLAGETTFPVQVAAERGIPLIVWPYHQPTEQVGMHSYTESPEMSRRGRAEFDLLGFEPDDFLTPEGTVTEKDIWDLQYPSNLELAKNHIVGIYLANYLPWDSRTYSETMIHKFGALGAINPRTFDTYDRIDDMTYMTIHDILKYALHGYSRVTDNLCREIRFGRISKDNAKIIQQQYQSDYPIDGVRIFLEWIGMKEKALEWFLERTPFQQSGNELTLKMDAKIRQFTNSFIANGPNVLTGEKYISYGKGLTLQD
jgi:N-acetyl sugar amidotransferase